MFFGAGGWRMTGSACTRWTLHRGNIIYIREGVRGREGQMFCRVRGWRIFFEGPGRYFFQVFFLHRFLMVFWSILEGFGAVYGGQNGSENRFLE